MTRQGNGGNSLAQPMAGADVSAMVDSDESMSAEELLVEEVSIDGMCGVY